MRFVLRLVVIGLLVIVGLVIVGIVYVSKHSLSAEDQYDEAVYRVLQAVPEDTVANEGLGSGSTAHQTTNTNIAIALVASVFTVAVLIMGIFCVIMIAISFDPVSTDEGDPLYSDWMNRSHTPESSVVDFDEFEDCPPVNLGDLSDGKDPWTRLKKYFPREEDFFPTFEA